MPQPLKRLLNAVAVAAALVVTALVVYHFGREGWPIHHANPWPVAVAAVLVVLADLALTGMLHFDGLADSADALLPHATPAQRLTIMKTPDVGAFGAVAVGIVLIARTVALASRPVSIALIGSLWCASRAFEPQSRIRSVSSTSR